MANFLDFPSISPDGIPEAVSLPSGFQDAFLSLTKPQRLWIVKRLNAPSLSEAARQAGVGENTVYTWRSMFPAFRLCEKAILEVQGDSSLQLARAIYKAAIPEVATRQVEQALEDHRELSDRQLMAQQRAREAVSKGAGLEDSGSGGVEEGLEVIALRLWRRR